LVSPWEQCTSASTTTFWLPEGHIAGEAVFFCLVVSLVGGIIILCCQMDIISESEFSDDELPDSKLSGDRSVCLACLTSFVGLSISFCLSGLDLVLVLVLWPGRPQTSRTLLKPWGSSLTTLGLTILTLAVYSPTPRVPGGGSP
jgi:hypothetical protein